MILGVKHHWKPFRTGIQSPFRTDASIVIIIIITTIIIIIISVRLVKNLLISMNHVILVANVCKKKNN